jgi:hypothetical protein
MQLKLVKEPSDLLKNRILIEESDPIELGTDSEHYDESVEFSQSDISTI